MQRTVILTNYCYFYALLCNIVLVNIAERRGKWLRKNTDTGSIQRLSQISLSSVITMQENASAVSAAASVCMKIGNALSAERSWIRKNQKINLTCMGTAAAVPFCFPQLCI